VQTTYIKPSSQCDGVEIKSPALEVVVWIIFIHKMSHPINTKSNVRNDSDMFPFLRQYLLCVHMTTLQQQLAEVNNDSTTI